MDISGGSFDKLTPFVTNHNLAPATVKTITKPATPPNVFNACVISADADIYIRRGGNAVAAIADVTDGTGSIYLLKGQRRVINLVDDGPQPVTPLASFTVISTPGGNVTCEWFR